MHSAAPVSYLFVPATRPERFDKALAAGADRVIIDLEDAVAPQDKHTARAALATWLTKEKSVAIRINSADTEWFADDLALCALDGVAEIILPKAGEVADVKRVVAAGAKSVKLLIESALGIKNIDQLAQQERVTRLIFGSIDFCVDMGIDADDRELDYFRSHIVLASRLAELAPPVDGVTTAIDDVTVLQADTLRGKGFGFGAKLCIHPKQVTTVNAAYRPTEDELAWARRVMDAAGSAGGAAVQVDGRMVDKPVLIRAQRLLAQIQK
jgi:citrate lyase subunit beta/citryl-CoA lyase